MKTCNSINNFINGTERLTIFWSRLVSNKNINFSLNMNMSQKYCGDVSVDFRAKTYFCKYENKGNCEVHA